MLATSFRKSLYVMALLIVVLILIYAPLKKYWLLQRSPSLEPLLPPPKVPQHQHPISYLVEMASAQFATRRINQSNTLREAVDEYQRRYSMPPPPHFDKWYNFASEAETELIDEYDTIFESLRLFWSMSPSLIRARAREALSQHQNNAVMGVSIRQGKILTVGSGQSDYQEQSTREMISPVLQWLPDMDLVFNTNDEPRIVIPHEDLTRMTGMADLAIRAVKASNRTFMHSVDYGDGKMYDQATGSPFQRVDRQLTWTHARMSCAPDTPARSLDLDVEDVDSTLSYMGIHFIHDVARFSDICLHPSTRHTIGLFNHPNAFSVSHELVPVFSPSKLSTFHDILYPSPYYYAGRTAYSSASAVLWDQKMPKLYWRGTTSGGFSQDGSWRLLLRQGILAKLLSADNVSVLAEQSGRFGSKVWMRREMTGLVAMQRYDAKFTSITMCEPQDCSDMYDYFGKHSPVSQSDAWRHRYLLDMDGHGLSGRFYAFLNSGSLPLKVSNVMEWQTPRLTPWMHYVPLSQTTEEYAEVIRYFEDEEEGRMVARNLAAQGQLWSQKSLRRRDMEVYMFRLLLEYARLVDDGRQNLGFQM